MHQLALLLTASNTIFGFDEESAAETTIVLGSP